MCVAVPLVVILLLIMFGSADKQLVDRQRGGNGPVIRSYWSF